MASRYGEEIALTVVQAHEQQGYEDGYAAFTTTMDQRNNELGIACGAGAPQEIDWSIWFDTFDLGWDQGMLHTWWPSTNDQGATSDGMIRYSNGQAIIK
jgi:hypothetical protein